MPYACHTWEGLKRFVTHTGRPCGRAAAFASSPEMAGEGGGAAGSCVVVGVWDRMKVPSLRPAWHGLNFPPASNERAAAFLISLRRCGARGEGRMAGLENGQRSTSTWSQTGYGRGFIVESVSFRALVRVCHYMLSHGLLLLSTKL